jgi:hypothetical protein
MKLKPEWIMLSRPVTLIKIVDVVAFPFCTREELTSVREPLPVMLRGPSCVQWRLAQDTVVLTVAGPLRKQVPEGPGLALPEGGGKRKDTAERTMRVASTIPNAFFFI